jgi:hypothetical protein
MIRKNKKTIDTENIINLFGGKHQIVADYEKYLRSILTVKAVEKWLERKSISTDNVLSLKTIAEKRGLDFKFEDYIKNDN